jgi:RNA recognition motif-containing protein
MSFTVFLGNLPAWVTADDIRGWLSAENLVADAIKVIRNPETQESKGFAFIDAPNTEEMNSIIRRFDRAPLEDRLLRANPAQPAKPKGQTRPGDRPIGGHSAPHGGPHTGASHTGGHGGGHAAPHIAQHQHAAQHASHPAAQNAGQNPAAQAAVVEQRPPRRGKKSGGKKPGSGSNSAFAEELAKAL